MKMMYNGTQIKSLNVNHYEMSTQDATLKESDMQTGVTAYARGRKITGTGKAFSFALYGGCNSNDIIPIPVESINTVSISCTTYPVRMTTPIEDLRFIDFSTAKTVAIMTVNGIDYPISISVLNNMITITCDKTATLQVVFGKDEYV